MELCYVPLQVSAYKIMDDHYASNTTWLYSLYLFLSQRLKVVYMSSKHISQLLDHHDHLLDIKGAWSDFVQSFWDHLRFATKRKLTFFW